MRFQLVGVSLLFTTTAIARVALTSNLLRGDSVVDRKPYVTAADHVSFLRDEPATGVISTGSEWNEAVLSGGNLWAGMHSDDRKASFLYRTDPHTRDPMLQTMQSEHDGDMKELWEKWGYNEDKEENAKIDKECDFEVYHKLKRAFDELGIKTQSKGKGGPNQCVQVDHKDGPKVIRDKGGTVPPLDQQKYIDENCGKEYRITAGTFQFGVNADDGILILINVISPGYSAGKLWGRKPTPDELPQVRSISDMAWGFWNRGGKIQNIEYLMVAMIMNSDTRDIIRQAHASLMPQRSETAIWPGYDFPMDTQAGQALLGSSVGRWAGYFLLQHKKQLGGNKFISKARVFKPDVGSLPYMLFYVDGPAPDPLPSPQARAALELLPTAIEVFREGRLWHGSVKTLVVKQSKDAKNILRKHIIHVST